MAVNTADGSSCLDGESLAASTCMLLCSGAAAILSDAPRLNSCSTEHVLILSRVLHSNWPAGPEPFPPKHFSA